ncbi:hypothetical protein F0344_15705 [Streptomyces finlayi]|uniref:Uncharacterized protein n=1 Tax=Streptomyces finlayi TaxID=67296 RepID=A0A7G7BKM2_9ACTN|nr:hypothetical protein [Streptomyces finlayi]QNE75887.1 hypothetical protein F0344_15705 [Streptomyces finlayi]
MDEIRTSGAYPVLSTRFGTDPLDLEPGILFEFGLEHVLGGVLVLTERSATL